MKVILITTGYSNVVDFLFHHPNIYLAGIMECRYTENNCYKYTLKNKIPHCFYKNFIHMSKWVETLLPDLMVTYKVPFLLPRYIFAKPQYGTINIHPALLPEYRGANPWFWIYYNMESKSGVTIHQIDEYEDHGDIWAQDYFQITLGTPLHLLQQEAEKTAINLLKQILMDWENIKPTPQKEGTNLIRTKKHFDFKKLSDLAAIDGVNLWHILRGFPFLLKKYIQNWKENI
ncbi:MAG: hypothetical protein LUE98_03720 [Tannerellaceae bacterium]|nr:hypothetical protein [Tannerellaceae bacterium]